MAFRISLLLTHSWNEMRRIQTVLIGICAKVNAAEVEARKSNPARRFSIPCFYPSHFSRTSRPNITIMISGNESSQERFNTTTSRPPSTRLFVYLLSIRGFTHFLLPIRRLVIFITSICVYITFKNTYLYSIYAML